MANYGAFWRAVAGMCGSECGSEFPFPVVRNWLLERFYPERILMLPFVLAQQRYFDPLVGEDPFFTWLAGGVMLLLILAGLGVIAIWRRR